MGVRVRDDGALAKATLQKCMIFADWSESQIAALCSDAEIWRYAKGEMIVARAQPTAGMWVVASGVVSTVRLWPDGTYLLNGLHMQGHAICFVPALDKRPAPFDVLAKTDCYVISVSREAIFGVVSRDQTSLLKIVDYLCDRLRIEYESSQISAIGSQKCRLAKCLAYLARGYMVGGANAETAEYMPGPIEVTQEDLGAMLTMSRQTVNRLMTELVRAGVVSRERNTLRVLDFEKLIAIMEEVEPLPDVWRAELLGYQARGRRLAATG